MIEITHLGFPLVLKDLSKIRLFNEEKVETNNPGPSSRVSMMANLAVREEDVEEKYRCEYCNWYLIEAYKIVPCGHKICKHCFIMSIVECKYFCPKKLCTTKIKMDFSNLRLRPTFQDGIYSKYPYLKKIRKIRDTEMNIIRKGYIALVDYQPKEQLAKVEESIRKRIFEEEVKSIKKENQEDEDHGKNYKKLESKVDDEKRKRAVIKVEIKKDAGQNDDFVFKKPLPRPYKRRSSLSKKDQEEENKKQRKIDDFFRKN